MPIHRPCCRGWRWVVCRLDMAQHHRLHRRHLSMGLCDLHEHLVTGASLASLRAERAVRAMKVDRIRPGLRYDFNSPGGTAWTPDEPVFTVGDEIILCEPDPGSEIAAVVTVTGIRPGRRGGWTITTDLDGTG